VAAAGDGAPGAVSTSVFPQDLADELTAVAEQAAATVAALAGGTPQPATDAGGAVGDDGEPTSGEALETTAEATPRPRAPSTFDLGETVASFLPSLLATVGLVALVLLVVAAVGILRGPRDL
jgi:hypothetical protein